jgi:hypothetical protein
VPEAAMYVTEWSSQPGIDAIKNFIKPQQISATHFKPDSIEKSEMKIKENFSEVIIF